MQKRWMALAAGMALTAAVLAGCGETVEPEKVASGGEPAQEQPADQGGQGEQKAQTFKVGDTIKLGDLHYTVHGVREVKGDEMFKPDKGKKWLAVEVTVENSGSEPAAVSSMLGFSLQDSEGYNYTSTPLPVDTKGQLDGELAAGRKMRGEVTFEVPADAKGFQLTIDANAFGFGQAVVTLE
ncbi:MAG TPA: DUF4352 domain-containing protein [Thermaerobacter sp.]